MKKSEGRKKRIIRFMDALAKLEKAPEATWRVGYYICKRVVEKPGEMIPHEEIERETKMSKASLKRAIRQLKQSGLLYSSKGFQEPCVYSLGK